MKSRVTDAREDGSAPILFHLIFITMNDNCCNSEEPAAINRNLCLICQRKRSTADEKKQISKLSSDGRQKLVECATLRKSANDCKFSLAILRILQNLCDSQSEGNFVTHKSCYATFSSKYRIYVLQREFANEEHQERRNSTSQQDKKITRSKTVTMDKEKCIVCQIDSGEHTRLVMTENMNKNLTALAEFVYNLHIRVSSTGDLIAADAKYHSTCLVKLGRIRDALQRDKGRERTFPFLQICKELRVSASLEKECHRVMERRGKRVSPVWTHFKKVARELAKCNYCPDARAEVQNKNSNTTNLINHLKNHHFPISLKMVQESDSGTPTGGDSYDSEGSVDVDEAGLLSEIVVPTQSPSPASAYGDNSDSGSDRAPSTSMSTTNCSTSTFMTPASTAPRRSDSRSSSRSRSCTPQPQGTLDSVCAPDSKATEKLHYAVTHYIVTCNRPLNTVEKPGFRDMLQTFKPGYKVLSRRVLTDEYIPKVKEQVVDHLKTLLKGGGDYSLTSDNWTSNADVPYASLTAHFFDKEWENLHAVTLSCRASQESHNGEMMKEFFEEALDSWGLPVERCVALTTDNASDMRLAAELMDLPHMRCIAHTIQNGVEAVFKTMEIKKALKECKDLASWQHSKKHSNTSKCIEAVSESLK
ncbi:E3 SUMO-protein ligase ZBED1 [Frankliniella fusca]|uniref:E3 SUMO-protein ligase ZBED1 n=1 Tax=Frankliniella fusca TaxID=407009 RepID=A0AAE1L7T2_9NEOP|nr:E3 SUMO-protein ligase ZBED1 [Frankliniella fusca]